VDARASQCGVRQRQRLLTDAGLGLPSAVKLENSANMDNMGSARKVSARADDFKPPNFRRAGVAEGVIMRIGGWKTRSVFECLQHR
jgi:hypothetical protein